MSLTIEVKFYDSPAVDSYQIPWSSGITIHQAMEACYDQYTVPHSQSPFTFTMQYYGTYNKVYLGYMTVAINGRQRSNPYIWNVYLNGVVIDNSIDNTPLLPGNLVEFRYESYSTTSSTNHFLSALFEQVTNLTPKKIK